MYRKLLVLVILVNLAGTAFGFYYYQPLYERFPWYSWIFVSDSPNATLLYAVAIFLYLVKRESGLLTLIGMANNIKYGLWTMFVIVYFHDYFLSPENKSYYLLMFALHLGMVLQPVFMLGRVRFKRWHLGVALLWLLLNDFVDYGLWLNPLVEFPFSQERILKVGYFTVMFSFVSIFAPYFLNNRFYKNE